ncbi:restriction endonuclease subunit S [Aeromonas allosaccharophila]|uniref:Restriction endonuclease subunit S n=1 Tax=Aeromonas allosaccharophila TaxID=656 RepID=A0ABZ0FDJ1_9GAMM|nr:restriction endonuclease subunit S [Aeromonas allosaccharophila]WOE67597.1 restriction endonuclease subunit S [Aeromonas allosaccharophila]
MTIIDKQNTTGGQGGSSSQEHGAGVGIMAEQMMQETAGKVIPTGYKQTEVGVIPEDWSVSTIGDCTRWMSGGTPNRNIDEYWHGTIPWISGSTLKNFFISTSDQFLTEIGVVSGSRMAPIGSVLILVRGSALHNEIRAGLVIEPVSFNQDVKALIPIDILDSRYLTFFILGMKNSLLKLVSSAGNSAGVLDTELVKNFKLYLPSKIEQTAIANVLSDSDALIGALEQLIAKKQAIKSATMQQLLTGRTRLPTFALRPDGTPKGYKPSELGEIPEDWEVVNFSSAVWFQEGPGVRQYQFTYSGVKLLNGTNIDKGMLLLDKTQRFISEKLAYGQYSHFMIDEGDILIACSGVTIERFEEKVTISKREDLPLCLNTSTMRFKVRSENIDKNYIKDFLKSSFFKDQIVGKATGSAQLNFGPYHVNQVKIALSVKAEQTAIATILSDMDNELQALTQKLEKARALKQGMMQQLLTGKIRLPLAVGA